MTYSTGSSRKSRPAYDDRKAPTRHRSGQHTGARCSLPPVSAPRDHLAEVCAKAPEPPSGAFALRDILRAVAHFAAWADYHAGGGGVPSRRAARLTYYASSGSQ